MQLCSPSRILPLTVAFFALALTACNTTKVHRSVSKTLGVTVQDDKGRPVPNARVVLYRLQRPLVIEPTGPVATVQTNSQGTCRFPPRDLRLPSRREFPIDPYRLRLVLAIRPKDRGDDPGDPRETRSIVVKVRSFREHVIIRLPRGFIPATTSAG